MHCRIRVHGHLDPSWRERLAGLRIAHEPPGTTLLTGHLVDQAALHGVILQILRLGLALLSLETDEAPRPARTGGASSPS